MDPQQGPEEGDQPKLQKKWKGPLLVEECLNDVTYRLRMTLRSERLCILTTSNLMPMMTYQPGWDPFVRSCGCGSNRSQMTGSPEEPGLQPITSSRSNPWWNVGCVLSLQRRLIPELCYQDGVLHLEDVPCSLVTLDP